MNDLPELARLMKQSPAFYAFIRESVTDEGWQLLQPYLVPFHIRLWRWVRGGVQMKELHIGQTVKVVSADYATDFYDEVGSIVQIDLSIQADPRYLVDFGESGSEWLFDDEIEPADNL